MIYEYGPLVLIAMVFWTGVTSLGNHLGFWEMSWWLSLTPGFIALGIATIFGWLLYKALLGMG